MANGIDIVIGAEVSGALQGLQKVEAATVKAGATINKLPASINSTNQALAKLKPGSNEASQSLINLSRVAQDAPYGFLGIANNINPLLESFQRLKASTGTTGGALKALGKELTGAGGIGLAIGVVSSLLVVFGDKLFGSGKKAKEASEEVERLNKVLKETERTSGSVQITAIGDTGGEVAKVQELAKVVQDQTRSYNERNNALIQLQSINKNYFGDLTLESDSLKGLTARVNEYSQALVNAQIVKILSEDIGKLSIELSKATNDYNKLSDAFQNSKNTLENQGDYNDTKTIRAYNENLELLKKQGSTLTELSNRKLDLQKLLSQSLNEGLKFKPLTGGTVTVKPDKIDFDFEGQFSKPVTLKKPIFIEGRIFDFNAAQAGTDLLKKLEYEFGDRLKSMEKLVVTPKINLSDKFIDGQKKLMEQFKQMQQLAETVAGSVSNSFSNAFSQIASGANVFESLGNAIKGVVLDLITAAIRGLIFKAVMNLILPGSGSATAGIGSLIGSFGGFRAAGGPVGAGRSYVVGENGPELFVPANSGSVMNGNQVAAMSYGGGGSSSGGRQIVRGQNIILAYARTNRAQNRLGRG